MKKILLMGAAAAVIGFAGTGQTSSPAYACAGKVAGEKAFGDHNPAFQPSGRGSWSLGGGATGAPRFGEGGGIVVPSSQAGVMANENAPLEPRDGGTNTFVTIQDKCPD